MEYFHIRSLKNFSTYHQLISCSLVHNLKSRASFHEFALLHFASPKLLQVQFTKEHLLFLQLQIHLIYYVAVLEECLLFMGYPKTVWQKALTRTGYSTSPDLPDFQKTFFRNKMYFLSVHLEHPPRYTYHRVSQPELNGTCFQAVMHRARLQMTLWHTAHLEVKSLQRQVHVHNANVPKWL